MAAVLPDIAVTAAADSGLSAGAGSVLGSAIGSIGNFLGAEQTNSASVANQQVAFGEQELAMKQQDTFQQQMFDEATNYDTQMADTTYQRGVADMKAAGLNPMLAYSQGGDPSPTAPMASGSSGNAPSPAPVSNKLGAATAGGVNTAQAVMQAEQLQSQIDLNTSLAKKNEADATNTAYQTSNLLPQNVQLAIANVNATNADVTVKQDLAAKLVSENQLTKEQTSLVIQQLKINAPQAAFAGTSFGQMQPAISAGAKDVGSLVNSASSIASAIKGTKALPYYGGVAPTMTNAAQ